MRYDLWFILLPNYVINEKWKSLMCRVIVFSLWALFVSVHWNAIKWKKWICNFLIISIICLTKLITDSLRAFRMKHNLPIEFNTWNRKRLIFFLYHSVYDFFFFAVYALCLMCTSFYLCCCVFSVLFTYDLSWEFSIFDIPAHTYISVLTNG